MLGIDGELPELKQGMTDPIPGHATHWISRVQKQLEVADDGDYGKETAQALEEFMKTDKAKSSSNGSKVGLPEWRRLYGIW